MVSNATAETQVVKDLANKKMTITRYFDAEVELVWLAWTEHELLDQWWAPKPWRAETKTLQALLGLVLHDIAAGLLKFVKLMAVLVE